MKTKPGGIFSEKSKGVTPIPIIVDDLESESKEPGEFEIYSMDIFLQFSKFNDGLMTKQEMDELYEFISSKNLGDEKIREKLKFKFGKFNESGLIDFVTFSQLLSDAGYTHEML